MIVPWRKAAFTAPQKRPQGFNELIEAALASFNKKHGQNRSQVTQIKSLVPDPLTGEFLVDDCLKFINEEGFGGIKPFTSGSSVTESANSSFQDEELSDTKPIELLKSFPPHENVVSIDVDLYSVDNDGEDNYPLTHPRNAGKLVY